MINPEDYIDMISGAKHLEDQPDHTASFTKAEHPWLFQAIDDYFQLERFEDE